MDIERIVVRLVADATAYVNTLSRAEARLLYFAGFVAEQVTRSSIQLAADFERLTIAFEVMTGSAEAGLKVLTDITKLAIESPFTSAELISAGKQVKAFGFDTDEIIPILSRLGDVSVATGTDINRIILAFGQVRTTGRLMGQELRQFTNAGIPILEYLAKVMGVASSAVPQLVRQGRVGFADVAAAFNMMTSEGGLFFGMMERTNLETVWGRWQNVVESLQVLFRNLALEAFKLFKVKELLTDLVESFKVLNSEEGIAGLKENIRQVYTFFVLLWEGVKQIYRVIVDLVTKNQEVVKTFLVILGVIVAVSVAVAAVATAWTMLSNPIIATAAALTAILVLVYQFGDGVQETVDRIASAFRLIGDEFLVSWKAIVDAVRGGDFDLAFEVLFLSVKIGWKVLLESLRREFVTMVDHIALNLDEALQRAGISAIAALKVIWFRGPFGLGDAQVNQIRQQEAADLVALARKFDAERLKLTPLNNVQAIQGFMRGLPEFNQLTQLREMADLTGRIGKNLIDLRNSLLAGFQGGAFPAATPGVAGLLGGAATFGVEDQVRWLQSKFAAQVNTLEFMVQNARRGAVDPGLGRVPGAADLDEQTRRVTAAHVELTKYSDAVTASGDAARRAVAKITEPLDVSAGARTLAAQIRRDMEHGADAMDKFTLEWSQLTEALTGPLRTPEVAETFKAMMGMAGVDMTGHSLVTGILGQDGADFGMFRAYEQFKKTLPNPETARPTTAMYGSREAWDILSRANTQQVDVQERIRGEIMTGNAIADAQLQEQRRTTTALEELRKQGLAVRRRAGQGGR